MRLGGFLGPDDVTVVTLTIPGREWMLRRNMEAVRNQTVGPVHAHLVDDAPGDVGLLYNGLVGRVETEWVCLCDDDNWLHPDHLRTILPAMDDADVVYSWESSGSRPRVNVNEWSPEYIERLGRDGNWLDTSCAVRTSKYLEVGGMPGPEDLLKDWRLWQRMVAAGARFRCVPEVTWTYQLYSVDGHVLRDPNGYRQPGQDGVLVSGEPIQISYE
jgi:hypothetical protein